MNLGISRQNLYALILSVIFLIIIVLFAFLLLIPKGKQYREQRAELKVENIDLLQYEDLEISVADKLKKLQTKNRHITSAFRTAFNKERFTKQYKAYFSNLNITEKKDIGYKSSDFVVYEVNTTSKIDSPKNFYDFLSALNKGDWIIKVDFPIKFKRDEDKIKSTFTMHVYKVKGKWFNHFGYNHILIILGV